MELVLPALISSIATLLAVWLQSSLSKRKAKKELYNFDELINSNKIKKFTIVIKDEENDEKEILLSKASSNYSSEKKLTINCEKSKFKILVEFSDEKYLNYNNLITVKNFSEKINQRFNNV